VMVRLNWGYGSDGTIPTPDRYSEFADRCKAWVSASPGARAWVIGNEMNLAAERPGGPAEQNRITPAMYADCFRRCRSAIHSLPGHGGDLVLTGAVAPYNAQTTYDGNPLGDWVQYLEDILYLLSPDLDGITLHAYTHGADPNLVTSEAKMNAPFNNRYYHFRAYRDFMRIIPSELRNLPVVITEAQPAPSGCETEGWIPSQAQGWVSRAYTEINAWNAGANNQSIQSLVLFRWSGSCNAWRIEDKDGVRQDFFQTINNVYRAKAVSGIIPVPVRQYRAAFLSDTMPAAMPADGEVQISMVLRNDSNFIWRGEGRPNPVRFGYRWFNAAGAEVPARAGLRALLPRDVLPGQQVTLGGARVVAPPNPGQLTVRLDLVEEGVTWFSDAGSPPRNKPVTVQPNGGPVMPDYAYTVTTANIPGAFPRAASTNASLTFRNDGNKKWLATGAHPVTLGFHWFLANTNQETLVAQLVRVNLPHDVATGESVALTIPVLAPFSPGAYNLMFDLVEEGVTEFRNAGAQPFVRPVTVVAPPYVVTWTSATVPAAWNPSQVRTLTIDLRNDGSKLWPAGGAHPVRLLYVWFDRRNAPVLVARDIRASLPHDMAPGDSISLPIDVLAPDRPGKLTLRFDLVEEGVTNFGDQGSPVLDRAVVVQAAQDYQVTFGDVLTVVQPGVQFAFNLKFRNDGRRVWAAGGANPVRVGYAWFDAANQPVLVSQDIRTSLPGDVWPGDELIMTAFSMAPDQVGRFRLRWSLVEEGVAWFYDRQARTLDVTVEVAVFGIPPFLPPSGQPVADVAYRASFTPVDTVTTMAPNAQRVVTLKVRNDGTKAWPKAGANPVHVGCLWYRGAELVPVAADIRTALPADMGSGQDASFGVQVMAPPFADTYTLRIDLVDEGITWFADAGTSRPLEFVVQVK
jgi:hypothetical protein